MDGAAYHNQVSQTHMKQTAYEDAMTVGELIEELKKYPQHTPVAFRMSRTIYKKLRKVSSYHMVNSGALYVYQNRAKSQEDVVLLGGQEFPKE